MPPRPFAAAFDRALDPLSAGSARMLSCERWLGAPMALLGDEVESDGRENWATKRLCKRPAFSFNGSSLCRSFYLGHVVMRLDSSTTSRHQKPRIRKRRKAWVRDRGRKSKINPYRCPVWERSLSDSQLVIVRRAILGSCTKGKPCSSSRAVNNPTCGLAAVTTSVLVQFIR